MLFSYHFVAHNSKIKRLKSL